MTLTMAYTMLPFLVAMVAAAPVAEQTNKGEEMVNVIGDNTGVDRAKRAEEEIVFGNQQNGGRLGAAKKSVPELPLFLTPQNALPELFPQPDKTRDNAGYVFAQKEQPVSIPQPEELLAPQEAGKVPQAVEPVSEGGQSQQKGEGQQTKAQDLPMVPMVEEGAEPSAEIPSENVEAEDASQPEVVSPTDKSAALPAETEMQNPVVSYLPENSKNADAEEVLQAKEQVQKTDPDDVESFLKELHEEKDDTEVPSEDGKEQPGDEGSAEAELMQVADQKDDGNKMDVDTSDYTQSLLKYILLHGDEYGRMPVSYGYPYPNSYYLQRRRRSLARRRLPHVHRRRSSGRQLARSKRTKRDLFDDDLYYNQAAEDEYEPDRDEQDEADLEELIAYLISLYPSLYDNRRQDSQYPGYMWYGSEYPDVGYPEYPEREEPGYGVEMPVGWEPANQQVLPAWEPAFYPEEVEEPSYYPAPAKRQMLSLVPGQRRKRYFYPFAREPYTHWGAFVPSQEKRDYDNAYWRLKKLAMVLADSARQPSSYLDAFNDFNKK